MAIRVIIADDADLLLQGMQTVLDGDHRYRVVASARSMDELVQALLNGRPDVVILSEWLHSIDILSAIEQLREQQPRTKLIVMGWLVDGLLMRDLFEAGVNGYLYKSDDLCQLLPTAIDVVMRDRPYLSPTANAEYLVAMQSPRAHARLDKEARQVLQMLAHGDHAGQISLKLGIDKRRVYWVREKLRHRFGAKTNEHLIQRAAAEGFIYPRD